MLFNRSSLAIAFFWLAAPAVCQSAQDGVGSESHSVNQQYFSVRLDPAGRLSPVCNRRVGASPLVVLLDELRCPSPRATELGASL